MAEVPLADTGGRVTLSLKHIRNGYLFGAQADFVFWEKYIRDANSRRITASQQRRTRGRADRCCRIEISKLHSLLRHPVEIGRFYVWRAKATNVLITLVIGEDNNEVRRAGRPSATTPALCSRITTKCQGCCSNPQNLQKTTTVQSLCRHQFISLLCYSATL